MTTWEFKAAPPYPEKKMVEEDYYVRPEVISILVVKDSNKMIDFKNDEDIYFEVNYYVPNQQDEKSIKGEFWNATSTKNYLIGRRYKSKDFRFNISISCPFTLTVRSLKNRDLSGLSAKFCRPK